MARVPLQIGRQSAEARSPVVSIERLLNGYLEQTPQGREPAPVYGTPGLVLFSALTNARGVLETGEVLYVVNDAGLHEVASDGTATLLGAIPGTGTVDMAGDGTNVVVVEPVSGGIYVWTGTTFGQVVQEDLELASSVDWLNGYFIFTQKDTEIFFLAPVNDPSGEYDPLDFDSADIRPDKLVRVRRVGRTLLMMGTQSVEFWYYSGDAVFPIERYADDPLDVGLIGMRAEAASNETIVWLASDLTARRLDGRTATRISSFAAEKAFKDWTNPELTVVTAHVWFGHLFFVFNNPEGCWVFDQATQLWHERGSYGMETWRVMHYARCYQKDIYAGDGVYSLDIDTYDENGAILPFEMISPWLDNQGQRFSIAEVEMRVETGVGSLTDNPKVTLERTLDGVTWTAPLERRLGKVGERSSRVLFGRQGLSRGCALRARITDKVKRAVLAMYAEVV